MPCFTTARNARAPKDIARNVFCTMFGLALSRLWADAKSILGCGALARDVGGCGQKPACMQVQQQSWEPAEPAHHEPQGGPPLAGENVMNVVLVGAECSPWSKTGAPDGSSAGALGKRGTGST